ncbi:MAG: sigma-70 family RNA polymerase sigma factor [Sedimentibacter sp.]
MDSAINHIIQQSLKGDKNNQEILIKMLRPLIYKNIYKYWKSSDHVVEDLVQEGYIVILQSLKSFDKSRNVHFLHYVKTKIMYYYKNYYRNTKNQTNSVSLSKKIMEDGSINLESYIDSNYNLLESIIAQEENIELLSKIKMLSQNEQQIIYLYYFEELPMHEISKHLNINYRTATGTKYNAIKKLKKLMIDNRR